MINSIFYSSISNIPDALNSSYAREYYPIISQEDIDKGFIMRYFVRQSNHDTNSPIREVSEDSLRQMQNSTLYDNIEIPWRIRGDKKEVSDSNGLAVTEAELVFKGIKYRLPQYLQFYKGL